MGFFCVNDVIYMFGGEVYKNGFLEACEEVWELHVPSCKIKRATSMGSGKINPTCIGPLEDGLVYVFSNYLSPLACESFNPKTCEWNPLPPPPPVPFGVYLESHHSEIVDHQLLLSRKTIVDHQLFSSKKKTIVLTTEFGNKFNLHVWDCFDEEEPPVDSCNEEPPVQFQEEPQVDSCNEEPPVQFPPQMEKVSFQSIQTEHQMYYRIDGNGINLVVGYPPSGALLLNDGTTYLLSLGNGRFCTFISGYVVSPFQYRSRNLNVGVNVFSLKDGMREVKVEEEVSVSLELEVSPPVRLHIRGCFTCSYKIGNAQIESSARL
ncbi:uncharacterized protein LOC132293998 [Cornus florida]|uniref:uncharacterized protein LOC132293998 n=1 Tax=Cornus florida TaxID=4283 RepID=UPI002898BB48|nr:uncharacterized protein LOC132293998 [Cornus florida]